MSRCSGVRREPAPQSLYISGRRGGSVRLSEPAYSLSFQANILRTRISDRKGGLRQYSSRRLRGDLGERAVCGVPELLAGKEEVVRGNVPASPLGSPPAESRRRGESHAPGAVSVMLQGPRAVNQGVLCKAEVGFGSYGRASSTGETAGQISAVHLLPGFWRFPRPVSSRRGCGSPLARRVAFRRLPRPGSGEAGQEWS
jgi:hypothetical protein